MSFPSRFSLKLKFFFAENQQLWRARFQSLWWHEMKKFACQTRINWLVQPNRSNHENVREMSRLTILFRQFSLSQNHYSSSFSPHYDPTSTRIWRKCWQLTSGTAVQNSQVINAWATVVGRRSIIPNNNYFLVTFEVSHGSYMSLASILLPPSPVRSSDNSIADVFHLKPGKLEKAEKNCDRVHLSSSFLLDVISCMCYFRAQCSVDQPRLQVVVYIGHS